MTDDSSAGKPRRRAAGKGAPIIATYDQILQWIEAAKQLPEKPERKKEQVFKGKAVVEMLYDVVKGLRSNGYTFDEIVTILKTKDGIQAVKTETFKTYFNQLDKERAGASGRKSKKNSKNKDGAKATEKQREEPGTVQQDALPTDVGLKPTAGAAAQQAHNSGTAPGGLQGFDVSRRPRG